jgi:hypothetical protein
MEDSSIVTFLITYTIATLAVSLCSYKIGAAHEGIKLIQKSFQIGMPPEWRAKLFSDDKRPRNKKDASVFRWEGKGGA